VTAERKRYWRPNLSLIGYPAKVVRHSLVRAALVGIFMGSAILFLQVSMDSVARNAHRTWLYSDIFIAVIATVLTAAGMLHYDSHMRADAARMRMIAEMNHHVRNALAAISLSVYAKNDPQLEAITRDAIQRIDWALREVLTHPESAFEPEADLPSRRPEAERRSA
jgi:signal transduction histidine kinase